MATNADLESLARAAATLGRRARTARGQAAPIPHLWFLTDPARTPDPALVVRRLPAGVAVVFRAFGANDAEAVARSLRRLTRDRGQRLLIGADIQLAALVGADGVHLPERLMGLGPSVRRARPRWLISAAAHGPRAVHRGAGCALDALLVSTVFPSLSPSAAAAMGPLRLAGLVRASAVPIVALGGITRDNAPRLLSTGAAGLAAIGGLLSG